jgi:hypothetical protein
MSPDCLPILAALLLVGAILEAILDPHRARNSDVADWDSEK